MLRYFRSSKYLLRYILRSTESTFLFWLVIVSFAILWILFFWIVYKANILHSVPFDVNFFMMGDDDELLSTEEGGSDSDSESSVEEDYSEVPSQTDPIREFWADIRRGERYVVDMRQERYVVDTEDAVDMEDEPFDWRRSIREAAIATQKVALANMQRPVIDPVGVAEDISDSVAEAIEEDDSDAEWALSRDTSRLIAWGMVGFLFLVFSGVLDGSLISSLSELINS
jgi:hypothetical protein